MQYNTLFYTLSAILIFTSILSIISEKIILSILSLICFLIFVGILFFGINSVICGIFQLILTLLSIILMVVIYKNLHKRNHFENILKTPRFWVGLFVFLILIILATLFIYYYINLNMEENLFILNEKAALLPSLSTLITTKSIFVDYSLAYFYVIIIFFVTICIISLLIRRKKGDKND